MKEERERPPQVASIKKITEKCKKGKRAKIEQQS